MAVRAAELRAGPLCCFSGTAAPRAAAGGSQPGMPCTDLGSRSLHARSVHCGLPAARPFGGTELHGHRASARTTGPTGRGAAGGGARRVPARPAWAAAPLPPGSVAARFPSALLWPGGSRCRCGSRFRASRPRWHRALRKQRWIDAEMRAVRDRGAPIPPPVPGQRVGVRTERGPLPQGGNPSATQLHPLPQSARGAALGAAAVGEGL